MMSGVLAIATAAATPVAHADATRFARVKSFPVGLPDMKGVKGFNIKVPAGLLFHTIYGGDRKINSEFARYTVVPSLYGLAKGGICNWQIDFSYKANGREYMRERGRPIHECGGVLNGVSGRARPKTLPRYGQACAELWVNGKFEAATCIDIVQKGRAPM